MLKNKFKIVAILTSIILLFTFNYVRAEDAQEVESSEIVLDTSQNEETEINEDPQSNIEDNPEDNSNEENQVDQNSKTSDDSIKKNDVYITGNDVTIDYTVDGNLFVIANNVTINSQIGGDAFICSNTLTIGEQGYVFSNLFTLSKNLTINGVVYDLYSASESTTIKGYIYRDAHISSNSVNIAGTVGRNAYIGCTSLDFSQNDNANNDNINPEDTQAVDSSSHGQIIGDLKYSSFNEISIPDGAVTGAVSFNKETESIDNVNTIQDKLFSLGIFVITVVLIWLLCLWLAPKFLENNEELITTKKILPVFGLGLLTPIVLCLSTIILFILGLTVKIGFVVLLTLVLLLLVSTSIFTITLNRVVCNKLKIDKKLMTFGILVATSVVIWIIELIPFVGGLLKFVSGVLGLGIIAYNLVIKNKKTEN